MTRPGARVLITGSNRGIGRVAAAEFCKASYRVAINGRDGERLESVRAELASRGCDVIAIPGDVSIPGEASRIITESVEQLGGLDILVNNAAVAMRGRFEDLVPGVVRSMMQTNVEGPVNLTVAALPHLKKSRGSVVFVSSLAGIWGFPLISVYAASKMALTAISESLRAELAGTGVHVGILHVGITQHDPDKAILAVDGSPFPLAPRPGADSQERVAQALLRMIRRRRARMVLTPAGHLLAVISRLFPRLLGRVVRASSARVSRIAK